MNRLQVAMEHFGFCVLAAVVGCAAPPAQLLVELCTDIPPREVSRIRIRSGSPDGPSLMGETASFGPVALEEGRLSFGVVGDPAQRIRLEVSVLGSADVPRVTRIVESGLRQGASVRVSLRLPGICEGARCGEETCGDTGRCEPVTIALEDWEARGDVCDVMDAPCDADGDGVTAAACGGADCDDRDPDRYPGNAERCDALDQDCDPCTVGVRDADADGHPSDACRNPREAIDACVATNVAVGEEEVYGVDCDDEDARVGPGSAERCNGVDDDCDGRGDEGVARMPFFPDEDGDDYGAGEPLMACAPPPSTAERDGDCDDANPRRNPAAAERCDEVDDDCDGRVDEVSGSTFYADADEDGFGVRGETLVADGCMPPPGFAAAPGDCRPEDPTSYPDAPERCDGLDNDCRATTPGGAEEGEDADGDEHAPRGAACEGGWPRDDCDDAEVLAFPGAPEFCSGFDADCDGRVDEGGEDQCECEGGCFRRAALSFGSERAPALGTACRASEAGVSCWGESDPRGGQADVFGGFSSERRVAPGLVLGDASEEIALGREHACARPSDGGVVCWGDNTYGQLGRGNTTPASGAEAPRGVRDVVQLALGWGHSCALTRRGVVYCWGRNAEGQLGQGDTESRSLPAPVTSLSRIVGLAATSRQTCARDFEGTLWCWGDGVTEPAEVLRGARRFRLAGDRTGLRENVTRCALLSGEWSCWGTGSAGAAGNGAHEPPPGPTPLVIEGSFTDLAPHAQRSCGLHEDGRVLCWGEGALGRLGRGQASDALLGVQVPGLEDATALACGELACCAERASGTTCWGPPISALLGDGRARDGSAPGSVARLREVTSLALGDGHACAVESGEVHCWGRGGTDALGVGDQNARLEPAPTGLAAEEVHVQGRRSCARHRDGTVWCWGSGLAGDGTERVGHPLPRRVDDSAMGPARALAVGDSFACTLDIAGAAWCWGRVVCDDCTRPERLPGGLLFDELGAGERHACGRRGGEVWCWGSATKGRLGDGRASGSADGPVQVLGVGDAIALGVGESTSCALRSGGGVRCWGAGDGAIGDGEREDRTRATDVIGLSDADRVRCGRSCMARSASRGWVGWGPNEADELGSGVGEEALVPVDGAFGRDFDDVALGTSTACGVEGGALRCWGGTNVTQQAMLGYPVRGTLAE